jgi:phasin family protein
MTTAKATPEVAAEAEAATPKAKKAAVETTAAPQPVRAAVTDGLKKASKAFSETKAFSKNNLDALTASASAASKGARALSELSVGFTKARIETNLTAAKSLTGAKNINEVLDIQHAFAKGAVEAYTSEFARLSETVSGAFREAVKPLSTRATTLYTHFTPAR